MVKFRVLVGWMREAVNARCGRALRKRQHDINIERQDNCRAIIREIGYWTFRTQEVK